MGGERELERLEFEEKWNIMHSKRILLGIKMSPTSKYSLSNVLNKKLFFFTKRPGCYHYEYLDY